MARYTSSGRVQTHHCLLPKMGAAASEQVLPMGAFLQKEQTCTLGKCCVIFKQKLQPDRLCRRYDLGEKLHPVGLTMQVPGQAG